MFESVKTEYNFKIFLCYKYLNTLNLMTNDFSISGNDNFILNYFLGNIDYTRKYFSSKNYSSYKFKILRKKILNNVKKKK